MSPSSHQHKNRNKFVPVPPPKVTFEKGSSIHSAQDKMDLLDLHGDSRKKVKDFHRKLVGQHMETIPRAHTAVVK